MSVTKAQLLSTGAALRHAERAGADAKDITKVTIDGVEVNPAEARKALTDAEKALADAAEAKAKAEKEAEADPSWWRRAVTSVGSAASTTTDFLKRNVAEPTVNFIEETVPIVNRAGAQLGTIASDAVLSDPEDVARKATVQISFKNGSKVDVPVVVVDETAASWLKSTSVVAGTASLVPFFGNFVQGGTGLLCALASGTSYLLGDTDLARSLGGMAKKHVTLGLVGFVPGLGVVTGAAAARDVARFNQGVPLDQLVEKPAPAQSASQD